MLLILLMVGGLVTGCGGEEQALDHGTDENGDEQVDPTEAYRIVTLAPALTQIIWDIGLGHRIVGVANMDNVAAEGVPAVGNFNDLNYERLVTLKPTHVFMMSTSQGVPPRLSELARSQDFGLFVYPYPDNVDDILRIIYAGPDDPESAASVPVDVGTALGYETEARNVYIRLLARLSELKNLLEDQPRPRVLMVIGVTPDTMASGPDTVLDNTLTWFCNAENAAGEATVQAPRYDREQLLVMNPDVIVLILPNDPPLAPLDSEPRLAAFRGLDITAVNEGRITLIRDPLATLPSSAQAKVAAMLAKAVHPEMAEQIDQVMAGRGPESSVAPDSVDDPETADESDAVTP